MVGSDNYESNENQSLRLRTMQSRQEQAQEPEGQKAHQAVAKSEAPEWERRADFRILLGIKPSHTMTFNTALDQLQMGSAVTRSSWPTGTFVFMQVLYGQKYFVIPIETLELEP